MQKELLSLSPTHRDYITCPIGEDCDVGDAQFEETLSLSPTQGDYVTYPIGEETLGIKQLSLILV